MTAHTSMYQTLLIFQSGISPALVDYLRTVFPVVYHVEPKNSFKLVESDPLPTEQQYAEADVFLSFVVPPNLKSYEQTPRLKFFQALSAGYNHLSGTDWYKSIPASNPLILSSSSGIHVSAIGEHVIATALMLFHKLHTMVIRGHEDQKWIDAAGEYGLFIRELRGATIGIVGYGHIGSEVARLSSAFGSTILALTRSGTRVPIKGYIVPGTGDTDGSLPAQYYSSEKEEERRSFFEKCDVVVNTLPSSPATQGFLGKQEFEWMKGDAIMINIGRGDTVDPDALLTALQAKPNEGEAIGATGTLRIGGCSLDVTSPEPLPPKHILFSLPNTIITPHMSGLSTTYYDRAADLLVQNVVRLREGKGALNAVRGKGEE